MKKTHFVVFVLLTFLSCNTEVPTQFSEAALNDTFIALNGETTTFQSILDKHKGKLIVVDVWATWCRDCIVDMPKLKELQDENPDVVFLFLSLDRNMNDWKKGISRYNLKGDHYFMQSGWDGAFGEFIDLDWISRYMVIDTEGKIKLFKAIKATDIHLKKSLTK